MERPRVISKNTEAAYVEDPLFTQVKDEMQTRGFSATNEWGHISMGFVQVGRKRRLNSASSISWPPLTTWWSKCVLQVAERYTSGGSGDLGMCTCAVADSFRLDTANASAASSRGSAAPTARRQARRKLGSRSEPPTLRPRK